MNYTEGQWKAIKIKANYIIKSDNPQTLAEVFCQPGVDPKETKTNAHLIAAAPDLYEIGRKVYRVLASGNITDQILEELNSVLNKAEGK